MDYSKDYSSIKDYSKDYIKDYYSITDYSKDYRKDHIKNFKKD